MRQKSVKVDFPGQWGILKGAFSRTCSKSGLAWNWSEDVGRSDEYWIFEYLSTIYQFDQHSPSVYKRAHMPNIELVLLFLKNIFAMSTF